MNTRNLEEDKRPVCFVVMGFGKKTDYELGKTFDLDATYEAIIEPAALAVGLRAIRADEFYQSAIIDVKMYEMLLRADVVIADISTGNVNAVYELGVRHALRPNTTVIMKENEGKLHFDLNHTSTFLYSHMGDDIAAREAKRAVKELTLILEGALVSTSPDSPVYTYLPRLQRPLMSDEEYAELLTEAEESQERLSSYFKAGTQAFNDSNMESAIHAYTAADRMKPGEPFIIQQLALATYKAELPSKFEALMKAQGIISALNPDASNDPETLGIAGAIRKRLWQLNETSRDPVQLDMAIKYYRRGFELRRDYYSGENLALCLDMRAQIQNEPSEVIFDRMSARKTRLVIVEILEQAKKEDFFDERSDRKWIYATLSHCYLALEALDDATVHEKLFYGQSPADWEIETYEQSKKLALQTLNG